MYVTVLSRSDAERQDFNSGDWVISINEEFGDMPKLRSPERVLQLCFADVDARGHDAMTEFAAEQILKFAQEAKANGKRLWVHCRAGVSRSAGVAVALEAIGVAAWTNRDEQTYLMGVGFQSKFHPNAHVSALVKRAFLRLR